MSNSNYDGTPESYLVVPESKELDVDALLCVLTRANSVSKLLSADLYGDSPFNKGILASASWTIEGLLDQARIIIEGYKGP